MLVPRENNITKYYPAVSSDDALVVYNQSTCGVDPDVYTNLTHRRRRLRRADLRRLRRLVGDVVAHHPMAGSLPQRLDNANGGARRNDNSWPRWSPDNGTFRGTKALLAGILVAAAVRLAGEQRRGR